VTTNHNKAVFSQSFGQSANHVICRPSAAVSDYISFAAANLSS